MRKNQKMKWSYVGSSDHLTPTPVPVGLPFNITVYISASNFYIYLNCLIIILVFHSTLIIQY